jgi:uncharacterized protein DUF3455
MTRIRALLAVLLLTIVGIVAPRILSADQITVPDLPPQIRVTDGRPFLVLHAVGTQNYTCNGQGEWGPAVPDAKLYASNGHQVGTHYAGPTWQFQDGSTAVGQRIGMYVASETSIAWLLLKVLSTTVGPDGDRLTQTTYIQRLNTVGGVPPAGSCTAGNKASVPYEADYYFYRASAGGD